MEHRTVLTFRSRAFNTTEEREYFINPGNFGDDLARWLIDRLAGLGLQVRPEPGQEDFGWYVNYSVGGEDYCLVLGYRPEDDSDGLWIGWIERNVGFVRSILGARNKSIKREGPATIHRVLADAAEISELRWHYRRDFDRGGEELGGSEP